MKFKAEIDIMPQDAILDPQGKTVSQSMHSIGLSNIDNVRVGRHVQLFIHAEDKEMAQKKVEEACTKILVNQVMEQYTFTLKEVETA